MPRFQLLTRQQASQMGPLQLAYLGDGVYELLVREEVVMSGGRMHAIHKGATSLVNARAQAEALEMVRGYLTEEEADIVRQGRNVHAKHQAPRSASQAEYAAATAFETLLGWLYVTGQEERLSTVYQLSRSSVDEKI